MVQSNVPWIFQPEDTKRDQMAKAAIIRCVTGAFILIVLIHMTLVLKDALISWS